MRVRFYHPGSKSREAMRGLAVYILVALSLATGLNCRSAAPDPDNGVSNASYRRAVSRAEGNMRQIMDKVEALRRADLNLPRPRHSPEWWDAHLDLLGDTHYLLRSTLQGATATARGQP